MTILRYIRYDTIPTLYTYSILLYSTLFVLCKIVVLTETGNSARLIAKYRPSIPILAVTSVRALSLNFSV